MCLLLLFLAACPGPRERVTVLDVDPGGALRVTTSKGTTTLTTPGTAAVRPDGRVERGGRSPAALQAQHEAVLATLPEPDATYTFHFATGQTTLDAAGRATLAALLGEIPRRAVAEVQITGHTDQQGRDAANERLSQARAEAVRGLLLAHGVPEAWVRVTWRGEREPLVDRPGQAHEANRRVEVTVR